MTNIVATVSVLNILLQLLVKNDKLYWHETVTIAMMSSYLSPGRSYWDRAMSVRLLFRTSWLLIGTKRSLMLPILNSGSQLDQDGHRGSHLENLLVAILLQNNMAY